MSYPPQTPSNLYSYSAQYSGYGAQNADSYSYSPGIPSGSYSFADYHLPPPPKLSSPPPEEPDVASVDATAASKAIKRLVSAQLRSEGYVRAEPQALEKLETEVATFVTLLYERAHEYANLANRSGPIPTDLLRACGELGMDNKVLHKTAIGKPKTKRKNPLRFPMPHPPALLPPDPRPPTPRMLTAEDEYAPVVIPATIRTLPQPLPPLPPSHTYLRTPISPPKKAALPSLEKKLKNASLVQGSLKNLLLATEDMAGQEDGELLGHIVNYEVAIHPRKRWRVGG